MVVESFDESYRRCDGYGCDGDTAIVDMTHSYSRDNWAYIAESSIPLNGSKGKSGKTSGLFPFEVSIEVISKQVANKVILINAIALFLNLGLALAAFYFAYTEDSAATSAFAADCLLDLVSSGIMLWRYYGNFDGIDLHAREQKACIYLGLLFEVSAIGIIFKSLSDLGADASQIVEAEAEQSYMLVYLASAATVVCFIMTSFKCELYRTLRDSSILLDVINSLISTVFAMSIVMSQILININPSFWYLDPALSLVLAILMIVFGVRVIAKNFDVVRPWLYERMESFEAVRLEPRVRNMRPNQRLIDSRTLNLRPISENKTYGTNLLSASLQMEQKNNPIIRFE